VPRGGDEEGVEEFQHIHDTLDKWLLPSKKWTVELLIVIMTLVGKTFNCTKYITECTARCIEKGDITKEIARILFAAFLPRHPHIDIPAEFIGHSIYKAKSGKYLSDTNNVGYAMATKGINTLSDDFETSATDHFHQITIEGISPMMQNLLLPMGLQSRGDQCICRPFVVGAFNNGENTGGFNSRTMIGVLHDSITDTMFSRKPRYTMADQYNTTLMAKTSFDSHITDSGEVCQLQVYDASKETRTLLGSVIEQNRTKMYGGLILTTNEHEVELESLFGLIGIPVAGKEYAKAAWGGNRDNTQTCEIHQRYSLFKVELENTFRKFLLTQNNPVDALKELATTLKNNSGGLLKDVFPGLSSMDSKSYKGSELPKTIRLCKLLLQGQSSLVDQLVEGNHRQSCISECIGSLDSTRRGDLALHLLFQDAKVVQIIPAQLEEENKPTILKVSPLHMVFFLGDPTKKKIPDTFSWLFSYN
jgi:hypothetical protein